MAVEETDSSPSTDQTETRKWKDCKVKPVPQSYVPDQDLHYEMWTSSTKGNALIIGNDFISSGGGPRPYADKDIQNMTLLLTRLGYDFRNNAFIKSNLTKQDMNETVNKFVDDLRESNPQSAVVYISSHGNKDEVLGNDNGSLAIPVLLEKFNGILPGKPKVIIIDACWGADETHGTPVSSSNSGSQVIMMPHNADIFLIHATSYGMYFSLT
ncbi:cell death protein 3-like [Lytechinus pictus]|uniref:cell death protein 3-like n=1 Tax=Lytechinus pictus TaxID=7653 RepID=UPI0030B9ECCD